MENRDIKNWKAYRSGASLTIEGVDTDGRTKKITHVREITPAPNGGVVAATFEGDEYRLLTN